jgi:biopolymer transport protein ExbD
MSVERVGGTNDVVAEMNTTPLIDVMLVPLVMLILTIPIQTHAVKIDLPQRPSMDRPAIPDVVNLEIDFDGTTIWNSTQSEAPWSLIGIFRTAPRRVPSRTFR